MGKKTKIVTIPILIIINFYLLFSLFKSASIFETVDNLISYVPTFLFTLTFLYQNIDALFERFNIFLAYVANPTVNWSLEYKYDTRELPETFLNELQNNLISSFSNSRTINFNQHNMRLEIGDFYNVEFSILDSKTIMDQESRYRVVVKTSAKISYRDSLSNIFNDYDKVINIVKNMDGKEKNSIYILKVKFDEHHPFIKILPKIINNRHKFNYKIDYEINETLFSAYNNTLEIANTKLPEIQKLSKKYIALSNDKLFN